MNSTGPSPVSTSARLSRRMSIGLGGGLGRSSSVCLGGRSGRSASVMVTRPACGPRASGCRRGGAAGAARAPRDRPPAAPHSRDRRTGSRPTGCRTGRRAPPTAVEPPEPVRHQLLAPHAHRLEAGARGALRKVSGGERMHVDDGLERVVLVAAGVGRRPRPQQAPPRRRDAQRGALGDRGGPVPVARRLAGEEQRPARRQYPPELGDARSRSGR